MNKDDSKPISFKTIQKNKKLGDFILEEKQIEEGREDS